MTYGVSPVGAPVGSVIMWSGSIATIPAGWSLCDGTAGTIDLRDKFIVGAGSTYAVAATGGEATHTLTSSEMPSHTHQILDRTGAASGGLVFSSTVAGSANNTGSAGGGGAHENRPPYYALAYIQRIT